MYRSLCFFLLAALPITGCGTTNHHGDVAADKLGDVSNPLPPPRPATAVLSAACGDGRLTAAGADRVLRAPYLQQATDHSVAILWTERAAGAAASVHVTLPSGGAVASVNPVVDWGGLPHGAVQLAAHIDGLAPATMYCYQLVDHTGSLTDGAGFRTAPAVGQPGRVAFAAFGDSGYVGSDQLAVFSQVESLPLDVLIHVGDVEQRSGTLQGYERAFFAPYASLLSFIPFFPAPGNHDYQSDGGATYRHVFSLPEVGDRKGNERWYSFDWGAVHFLVYDTQTMGDDQTAWVQADLAATRQPWKVAYGHRPPYSSGAHGSQSDVRNAFSPLFEKYGVSLVLSGHDHDYERTTPQNGVTYVVTGGGGAGTRPVGSSSFTAFSDQVLNFVYVVVEGDWLSLWAIDASGTPFDSARIPRPRGSST